MVELLDRILFLKGIEIFSEIPSESLMPLAQVAKEESFEAGDTIIQEGEMGNCLYVIVDGDIDVTVGDKKVATRRDRECLGEMSLLDSEPRCASAIAASNVVTLRIAQEDFYDLLSVRGEIARGIIALLSRRMRETIRASAEDRRSLIP
jgi:CRP-like cAMP-binding protein